MTPNPQRHRRMRLMALVALSAAAFAAVAGQSSADVSAVSGSAFGASGEVTLGDSTQTLPPTPSVTLPPGGGNETDSAASAGLVFGMIPVFQTGALTVSTQGTTGPTGSVTSSATVANVVSGGLTLTEVSSTCTANEAGVSGSTTVTGGRIVFVDPDPTVSGETGEVIVDVPVNPEPNLEFTGEVLGTPDMFTIVFNEQLVTADSITVNAVHIFLLGPFAIGEVIVGQSVCGVAVTAPTTTQPPDATTTQPPDVTTTTQPPDATTTTPTNVTSTTMAGGPSCHPAYTGACVPIDAVDVDCAGSPGGGPVFVQETNFTVVDPAVDPFGLDGNNDGVACEPDDPGDSESFVTTIPPRGGLDGGGSVIGNALARTGTMTRVGLGLGALCLIVGLVLGRSAQERRRIRLP